MSRYWCELAWLGGAAAEPAVLIDCVDGRIASVATGTPTPADAIALPGLTLPGLANAHSHAFQRVLRGRTQAPSGGSFWTWREQMYAAAQALDPARSEALARATFGEMALAGITVVGEFDYIHHSDAIIRAAAAAGIRLTLIDACYLEGGLPRFRDADAHAWAERVDRLAPTETVRLAAAIHSVRAVDPVSAELVAGFAAQRATHIDDEDARRLAVAAAFTCLCPTTERDLADGIGRVHSRLTLGSDSQAVIDLFEEMRAVELDVRLATGVRGTHAAAELIAAVTATGYASLGWPDGGRIEPGALADLVAVSLRSPRLAGTRAVDALGAVVFAGSAVDVDTVIVAGREIVRSGLHLALDVPAELSLAIGALA
jgi:cytosine/adenosine deaminase-related metal-dependent hydrolase